MAKVNMVPGWVDRIFVCNLSTFTRTRITHKLHASNATHVYSSGARYYDAKISDYRSYVLYNGGVFISR